MASPDLQALLRDYLREHLATARAKLLKTPHDKAAFVAGAHDFPDEADAEAASRMVAQFRQDLRRRDTRAIEPVARRFAEANGVPEDQRRELSLGLLQAELQVQEQVLMWLRDGVVPRIDLTHAPAAPAPEPVPQLATPPQSQHQGAQTLSELLPGFLDLMATTGGWKGQTMAQSKATFRMFQEVCGNRPLAAYTRKDLSRFYEVLRSLPALYSKKPEWRDLSLAAVVEAAKGANIERVTMKTVKRHFSALGKMFGHFKKHGEYEGENPAHGFEFPGSKSQANKGRHMWEGEELTRLFSSPVWSGCLSAARRSTPGKLVIKDEKYWLPLLGLYHGNRLEEFAQLQREDVRQVEGVWCFDINDEGLKQVKNAQSKRLVPIHPKITTLGFLEYVFKTAPKEGNRIFPNLQPGGADNKLGFTFSKWFSRYRQDIGVFRPKLDYHSFRHGVTTKLYAADVQEAWIDVLTGHSKAGGNDGGTSRTVYLKGLPIAKLYEAISKVAWPELPPL